MSFQKWWGTLLFFSEDWVEAKDMQQTLQHISAALGYGQSEIFQNRLPFRSWLWVIFKLLYDAESGLRYAIKMRHSPP